jgi:hypothetical protein
MVEVTYQMVLSTIQTISLIVGIAYYMTISRKQQKTRERSLESQEQAREAQEDALETRKAQMFMQIYNESYNNDSFIDAYVRLADFNINSYDEYQKLMEDEDNKKASTKVAMFYEGVGVLVREGHISIRLFALLMTGMTRSWWERLYKSYVEEGREKRNFKRWMSESEYLYNKMMKYHEEHPELAS